MFPFKVVFCYDGQWLICYPGQQRRAMTDVEKYLYARLRNLLETM